MMIDFWVSQIPPTAAYVKMLNEMAEKNKEAWGDKVKICTLSIEDSHEPVKALVEKEGWTSIKHYHKGTSTCGQ